MSKYETITDIIAEMRFHGQQNIDAEKDKPEYGVLTMEGRIVQNFADRLEAAHKREAAIHAMTVEANERLRAHLEIAIENNKRTAVGNAAAMRESLGMVLRYLQWLYAQGCTDRGRLSDEIDRVVSAINEPTRNCDVGTAEEQTARYRKFCSAHKYLGSDFSHVCKGFGKGRCPFFNNHTKSQCEFAWAQMPYEEGERQ